MDPLPCGMKTGEKDRGKPENGLKHGRSIAGIKMVSSGS